MFRTLIFVEVFGYKTGVKLANQVNILLENLFVPDECAAHGEWHFQLESRQTLFHALHYHRVHPVINPAAVQLRDQLVPELVPVVVRQSRETLQATFLKFVD